MACFQSTVTILIIICTWKIIYKTHVVLFKKRNKNLRGSSKVYTPPNSPNYRLN